MTILNWDTTVWGHCNGLVVILAHQTLDRKISGSRLVSGAIKLFPLQVKKLSTHWLLPHNVTQSGYFQLVKLDHCYWISSLLIGPTETSYQLIAYNPRHNLLKHPAPLSMLSRTFAAWLTRNQLWM